MQKIAIIGLGLIGGSLGLALRQASDGLGTPHYTIAGYDRDPERLNLATQMQAIDQASNQLSPVVRDAPLVILATPALAIRELFIEIAPILEPGTIITDTASTKAAVMRWAQEILPASIHFIGGHPMAGATGSLEMARPDLFQGATYCLVPGATSNESAIALVEKLIRAIGAIPLCIDAVTHDRCVAAISHLPFIASAALVEAVATSPERTLLHQLASSGFRDTTRLAAGDPTMYHDISLTNLEAITSWLDTYIEQLQAIRQMLQAPPMNTNEHLLRFFQQAQQHRTLIIEAKNP